MMRWALVWICSCNPDPVIHLVANSKAECRAYGAALYVQGQAWFCAQYHEDVQSTEVVIWPKQ